MFRAPRNLPLNRMRGLWEIGPDHESLIELRSGPRVVSCQSHGARVSSSGMLFWGSSLFRGITSSLPAAPIGLSSVSAAPQHFKSVSCYA
ncbi:hypothetical protein DPEC_G00339940 [Dallia pectoralis]|uniref:Uncharacterized protein n=1 Tax=Dallia pectoralis TaxID=75939 RepID=A0ACC2F4Y4_DALPE|nr:hypothetical protein DPEC_G00339940 [Dallia pectoralis]